MMEIFKKSNNVKELVTNLLDDEDFLDQTEKYQLISESTEFTADFESNKDRNFALKTLKNLNKDGEILKDFVKKDCSLSFRLDLDEIFDLDFDGDDILDLGTAIGLIFMASNAKCYLTTHKNLVTRE